MKLKDLFFITLSLIAVGANAHGPTPQKANESILINAPIDKTWGILKNFDQISSWHPDVKFSSGDGKNASGGERSLTLSNDGILQESLDYYSNTDHEYNYRLKTENTDAFPVSFYTGTIQLIAEGDKTWVKWKSRYYRGDTSNFPSEKLNDESAIKAMITFIQNGLKGLKEKLE